MDARAELIGDLVRAHIGIDVDAGSVQFQFNDWRWVANVGELAIAFIAENAEAADRLSVERALLRKLESRVSFRIPVPVYCSESLPVVDVRRMSPGKVGERFHGALLQDAKLARAAAGVMARMLAELHGSITSEEARAMGLTRPKHWPWSSDRILDAFGGKLSSRLDGRMCEVLAWHDNPALSAEDTVIIHGDFGSHNFAFDPDTGLPCGLFDFENTGWDDRHRDFMLLPSYGPEVMSMVLDNYARVTGADISAQKVRMYHAVEALSTVAWRIETFPRESAEVIHGVSWVRQALLAG